MRVTLQYVGGLATYLVVCLRGYQERTLCRCPCFVKGVGENSKPVFFAKLRLGRKQVWNFLYLPKVSKKRTVFGLVIPPTVIYHAIIETFEVSS
jgi:hypothetical protein